MRFRSARCHQRNATHWLLLIRCARSVTALVRSAPKLAALWLSSTRVSDAGIEAAIASCGGLKLLDLAYLDRTFSDRGIRALSSCTKLEELHLSSFVGWSGGSGLARDVLSTLAATVRRLHLDAVPGLCDHMLEAAVSVGRLQTLCVGGNPDLTDALLCALGDCCCRLERLDVWGCGLVSDHGLSSIAAGCPSLSRLDVSRTAATDAGAHANQCKHHSMALAFSTVCPVCRRLPHVLLMSSQALSRSPRIARNYVGLRPHSALLAILQSLLSRQHTACTKRRSASFI
eukprot:SAG31_NODE_5414_length_2550_cov_1.906977_2_plen_287_part_00